MDHCLALGYPIYVDYFIRIYNLMMQILLLSQSKTHKGAKTERLVICLGYIAIKWQSLSSNIEL